MTTRRPELVVISGGKNLRQLAPACLLYTGSYFRACRDAARSLRATHGYRILSALHGIVDPRTELDPYDLRMGQSGCVTGSTVRAQAETAGLLNLPNVIIRASRAYVETARTAWPDACAPLAAAPGLGHQLVLLSKIQMRGSAECTPSA
ncbi:DUF6884 domain-containing protein [Streptomyces roseifaciens]